RDIGRRTSRRLAAYISIDGLDVWCSVSSAWRHRHALVCMPEQDRCVLGAAQHADVLWMPFWPHQPHGSAPRPTISVPSGRPWLAAPAGADLVVGGLDTTSDAQRCPSIGGRWARGDGSDTTAERCGLALWRTSERL